MLDSSLLLLSMAMKLFGRRRKLFNSSLIDLLSIKIDSSVMELLLGENGFFSDSSTLDKNGFFSDEPLLDEN